MALLRNRRRLALWALTVVAWMGGCQETDNRWTQIQPPEQYPHRNVCGRVTVAAECWSSPRERKNLFRSDPGEDILPVRLVLFNESDQAIRFSNTQAVLELPDGTRVRSLPTSQVSDRLQEGDAAAQIFNIITLGYGGGIAQAISGAVANENRARRKAVRTCSMELATIDAGQALTGFVFYRIPGGKGSWPKLCDRVVLHILRLACPDGQALSVAVSVPTVSPPR